MDNSVVTNNNRKLLVIDTDPGVDDANALLLALAAATGQTSLSAAATVLAITTVYGNASVQQCTLNVFRILKLFECERKIPVFMGASSPLITSIESTEMNSNHFHAKDGMGSRPDVFPQLSEEDSEMLTQKEHAVHALIRLTKEHQGEITLVCLGPLTNIAIALKVDPGMGKRLKNIYSMGGNYQGVGNATMAAEFNYYKDPEAAHIVLHEISCPMTIMPWESWINHPINCDWWYQVVSTDNKSNENHLKANFFSAINKFGNEACRQEWNFNSFCDEVVMACALDECLILRSFEKRATIELGGKHARGQLIIDWPKHTGLPPNVRFIAKYDVARLQEMFSDVLKH